MFGLKIITQEKWEHYEGMRIDFIKMCNKEVEKKEKQKLEDKNKIDKLPQIPERKYCDMCQKGYYVTQMEFCEFKETDFVYETGKRLIGKNYHKKQICKDCVKKYKLLDVKKEEK